MPSPGYCPVDVAYAEWDYQQLVAAYHERGRTIEELQRLKEDLERAREALHRIDHWCSAYPATVFPEPRNLDAVRAKIGDSEMARMHASWARHLLKGIGRVAKEGMQPSPGSSVDGPAT